MARARSWFRCFLVPSLLAGISPACGESSAPAESGSKPAGAPDADGDAPAATTARSGSAGVAPVTSSGDEPYDSTERGALHGTILFEGEVPERFTLGAAERSECKHHPEVDQRANVLVVNDGKLAGAFVYIKSGYDESAVPAPPSTPVSLDQRGCMYVPRVVALQLGQKLLVTNSDPTNHNVHALPKKSPEVNRNMGAAGPATTPLEFTFTRAEREVPFKCDIHPWMGAVAYVVEHPWFAVTDERGAFLIRDVPPGEYVVEAEHEKLGAAAGKVKVTAGRSTGFSLTLRAKK